MSDLLKSGLYTIATALGYQPPPPAAVSTHLATDTGRSAFEGARTNGHEHIIDPSNSSSLPSSSSPPPSSTPRTAAVASASAPYPATASSASDQQRQYCDVLSDAVNEAGEFTPPPDIIAAGLTTTSAASSTLPMFTLHKDIPYITGECVYQRGFRGGNYNKQALDIYTPGPGLVENNGAVERKVEEHQQQQPPQQQQDARAVVIHFHGGSWKRGDRAIPFYGSPSLCQGISSRGVIAVAPSYRLGNHETFKEDTRAAILWVIENIADYGGDPKRIFISGHSAGGNIAALDCRVCEQACVAKDVNSTTLLSSWRACSQGRGSSLANKAAMLPPAECPEMKMRLGSP
eukprot:gene1232-15387_t